MLQSAQGDRNSVLMVVNIRLDTGSRNTQSKSQACSRSSSSGAGKKNFRDRVELLVLDIPLQDAPTGVTCYRSACRT